MRQMLYDILNGRDPLTRFAQPSGRLAADTLWAVRSRGWVHRKSYTLTAAGRKYLNLIESLK